MSLEKALEENTAAVRELVAAMNQSQGGAAPGAETKTAAANKTTKEEKAEKQQKTEEAASNAEVESQPAISEEELHGKVRAYAKSNGKQEAKSLMAGFGYEKMADIAPKDFDAISKAIDEADGEDDDI